MPPHSKTQILFYCGLAVSEFLISVATAADRRSEKLLLLCNFGDDREMSVNHFEAARDGLYTFSDTFRIVLFKPFMIFRTRNPH